MIPRIIFVIFALFVMQKSFAQEKPNQEIREYKSMKYKIITPSGYDPAKLYPLVISLHGGTPDKELTTKPEPKGDGYGINQKFLQENPCFVLVPAAIRYWYIDDKGKLSDKKSLLAEIKQYVDTVLMKEFKIDKKRIYLVGYSDGATGIFHALAWYPDYFAGAIPMSGWLSPKIDTKLVVKSKTPVWWFFGKTDTCHKWADIGYQFDNYKKSKMMLKLTLITKGGHDASSRIFSQMCANKEPSEEMETLYATGKFTDDDEKNPMAWLFKQQLGKTK